MPPRSGIPVIHRPKSIQKQIPSIQEESKVLTESTECDEIKVELKGNEELKSLKITVNIPPIQQYELKIIKIDDSIHGSDPKKDIQKLLTEEIEENKAEFQMPKEFKSFDFLQNEIILDLKTCNLTCDKGTEADYICIGTSIIKPSAGESEFYGARILVFEIVHDLEKIAEMPEKRSAAIIDCCKGYLISNTEGPDLNTNTIGFKVQLYKLNKIDKKLLDPNPTQPTKIMATTINVLTSQKTNQTLVLFGDVRKSFTIMMVKDQQNSFLPVLQRAYECFQDVSVKATELWKISDNKYEGVASCIAAVSTQDYRIQLYTAMYQSMMLKGEVYMGTKVTGLKKIIKNGKSNSIVFVTQNGRVGILKEVEKKRELLNETLLEYISNSLPWQGGLSPLHGSYYPRLNFNHGLRKISYTPVKNISKKEEAFLFYEMPITIQKPKKN